ncbi:hypothetical protein Mapa_009301 [Marchantia paleacea]|nr:hypothetical protein Mapa_009301 [Marchantia paleacea]
MSVCCTLPVVGVYFPQWGGMLWGPSGPTEEVYYTKEWSAKEQEGSLHHASLRFAENARSE